MTSKSNNKDTTSALFNRYVWLADLIHRREKITFEEINEHWLRSSLNINGEDLPLRTFHNHRKAIEQMFDINIECDKKNGYKYYIENSSDMESEGVRAWLLNTFAINNLINESNKIKDKILFEKIPSAQIHLTPIIEAMTENLSIEIEYHNFCRDNPYTQEVFPYCTKIFKQRWYLIALNIDKKRIQTYALDRLKKVSVKETKFEIPNDFNPNTYFKDSFGIIVDDNINAVKVMIKSNIHQAKYLKSLPLHPSQKEEEATDSYIIFSYYIRPTYDFIQEILSHGTNLEVLSPKWLRKDITMTIKEQYNIYKNK